MNLAKLVSLFNCNRAIWVSKGGLAFHIPLGHQFYFGAIINQP